MEDIDDGDATDMNGRRGGTPMASAGGGDSGPAPRGPRPRGAVTGGWGFDGGSEGEAGGGSRPAQARMSADPPSPQANNRKGHFDGDDEVVPTIPDLEEEAEEDITRQVAAPPSQGNTFRHEVKSVRELDVAMSSRVAQLPTNPEEGVDLAPLMQCLCSERQVFELDQTWDHELIFQEVASAINSDLIAAEEGEQDTNQNDTMQNAAP